MTKKALTRKARTRTVPSKATLPASRSRHRLRDADYAALASFRKALRIFMAFSEDEAEAAGLTAQQHQAILAIRGLGEDRRMTVNELAEHLLLKPQTAVELVDRLELAGFIRRKRDDEDRRRVFLMLTPRADRIIEKLSASHLQQIRRDAPQLIELLAQMSKPGRRRA